MKILNTNVIDDPQRQSQCSIKPTHSLLMTRRGMRSAELIAPPILVLQSLFLWSLLLYSLLLYSLLWSSDLRAADLSYSGRLLQESGQPIDGPADLTIRFFRDASGGSPVGPVLVFSQTPLLDGVFQITMTLTPDQTKAVFGNGDAVASYLEVEAGGKVFPRQRFLAAPLALRVPVDNSSLTFNNEGKLMVDAISQSQVSGLTAALAAKVDSSSLPSQPFGSLATASSVSGGLITDGSITDADLSPAAGISQSKLATISAPGKVSGSAITSGTIAGTTAINGSGAITTSGMITGSGHIVVGGTGSATTELRFNSANNSNSVSLKAPNTLSSNVSWTLPPADGTSGQLLSTNGAGGLGWSTGPGLVTLTDAPTINVDASLGTMFQVTLGGNRTLAAPTNQKPGATYIFKLIQDGTGSRTLAFNPAFIFPGSVSSPRLSYLPNSVDIGQFASDGTNMYYLTGWLSSATVLIPPGSLTASPVSTTQINLTWVDTNSTEIGYLIERSLDNSTWATLVNKPANSTSHNDGSLSDGTRYFYRVITIRDAGNSAPVYADAWTPLNAPTSFNASANSASEIVLTWADNTTLETGYRVERSLTGTSGWTVVTTTAADALTYTDTGLAQATRYYYRISAVNANMVSSYVTFDEITAPSSGICGNNSADQCYLFSNMPINSALSTPGGKNLILVYANGSGGLKIWKEDGGSRILRANGLDQWTKKLNENGRGLSGTDFTDPDLGTSNTLLQGRTCPTNVYIDDSNMTTTGNCVYYSPGYTAQRLDAPQNDGTTNQTTTGSFRLGAWNTAAGGNGTGASWYEGNINTCGSKGMRLPTFYETTAADPGSDKPTDATPNFAGSTGVPNSGGWTLTSSAFTLGTASYWVWAGTGTVYVHYFNTYAVRCVVP